MLSSYLRSRLALLVVVVGLLVTSAGATVPEPAWTSWHAGVMNAVRGEAEAFASFEYRFARSWHGMHPWVSAGAAESRAALAGAGLLYHLPVRGPFRFTVGTGPVYYSRRGGRDLGFRLQFNSFLEASVPVGRGRHRVALRFAHVSNARLGAINPGTELVTLGYAFRLP